MTYEPKNLQRLASTGSFTIWHYRTDDHFDEIRWRPYFKSLPGWDQFSEGDMLLCTNDEGGMTLWVGMNSNGVFTKEWGT